VTGDLPARTTIVDGFRRTTATYADRAALRWWSGASWSCLTWADYRRTVDDVANGLLQWDVEPGERVAILASNRPEWHVTDLAILSAGLVTVPIYPSSSAGQVASILQHSGARLCVTDSHA
jgi:long-chain acyl-CoA synthetase